MGFMTSLQNVHFQEFWLPCTLVQYFLSIESVTNFQSDSAFHLTSTITLLVRCALETTDQEVARSCLANVDVLRSLLRRVREEEDWDVADMCLDHCERILSKHPEISNNIASANGANPQEQHFNNGAVDENLTMTPAAIILPETSTHNDIVDDMMSISGTFGTLDGFPFDMTGIWDVSGFQDVNFT